MKIRLADNNDLSQINDMFKLVVDDLKNVKKVDMLWGDKYPFCEFKNDINNKEMYILEENDKIVGSFSLSEYDDPDYQNIGWKSNNKKFFYINRLAISPLEQGNGYAKQAMNFIDNYAKENNYNAIRLVVYENNIYAIKLYEKFNFERIEDKYFEFSNKIFIGYEKILK